MSKNRHSLRVADTVQVALRIRPLVESEIQRGCQPCLQAIIEENQVQIIGTEKAFTFNHVFDQTITQADFYNKAIKNLVHNLFKGFNVTILAYGQTGSGKTHSMGTCYDGTGEMGVIPRSVQDIFDFIKENEATYNFQLSVSFLELYKENLYDLLSNKPREQCLIDIREDLKGIKMPGLTEIPVNDAESTIKCLINGSAGRAVGATAMNAHSSRSHAIFTVNIFMEKKTDKASATTAKFHLVDLAGSERSKKTKATGERFKEGVNINKGLLALGNVISALGDESQKGFICYRDSKLTRLLQNSLGGNSMTLMIACVSPADYNLEETISTLRYADRARKIKNKPIVNQDPQKAEIIKLNQIIHTLRMQLAGECLPISSEELTQKDEELLKLRMRNRELTSELSKALADNTHMYERQLLLAQSNDNMKKQINEFKEMFNITVNNMSLKEPATETIKEDLKNLENLQNLLTDIQKDQKNREEEILTHEYQTQNTPTSGNKHVESDVLYAEAQEKFASNQLDLQHQLQDLERQLAMKAKLKNQMESNNNMKGDVIDSMIVTENEEKINKLEKEKLELVQQLKQVHTSEQSSKLAEQRRQRVKELEVQISELKKKVTEQARLIKMKEKDELKIKQLNSEIQTMKSNKVKLIRSMKAEEQKFREWKQTREKEIMRLKNQDRKLHNQIVKMESMHKKQQTVLKRKVEEAAAMNKRLKDALALQKIVQERRFQNNGKLDKIHQYVSQEVEILSSTIGAKKSLENLMEERATLTQQLEHYKNNPDLTQCSNHVEQLNTQIEVISAHISDLQQKILDSDQENKTKSRWDSVQTMVDAKCALKHLFDLVAEIRSKAIDTEFELNDIKNNSQEKEKQYKDQINDLECQIRDIEARNREELAQINKENEEKISVYLKHLATKEHLTNDEHLKERLVLQSKELERLTELQELNMKLQEEIEKLKDEIKTINRLGATMKTPPAIKKVKKVENGKKLNKPKPKAINNITYVADEQLSDEEIVEINDHDTTFEPDEDDAYDDDEETPIVKRTRSIFSRTSRNSNKENDTSRLPLKRSSDGSAKCSCKSSNCKTSLCGCKKLNQNCSKLCKCVNCCNNKDLEKSMNNDTDSDNSFKKPRLFAESDDKTVISTPLKYKNQYFENV